MRKMKDSGIEWIGEIPQDWEIGKISALYDERKQKVNDRDYPPLSVTMQGILPQLSSAAKTDAHDDRKLLCKGDFAINSRSDRRGSCGISKYEGSISLINIVLKPRKSIEPNYYNWLFHSTMFSDEFYKWGHGIVDDLWTTNWQDMKHISIPTPSILEQQKISAFLDRKCTEIDSVISKTKATIEEYKKLKQSVITQAVTKGIIPNRPMKDSGIEWIGEIPQEWEVIKMKYLGKCRNGLTYSPDNLTDENNGTLVLRSSNIKDGKLVFTDNVYVNMNIRKELLVQSGDILICSRNGSRKLIGKNAIIPSNLKASFGAFMMIFQCKTPEYVKFILDSEIFSYYLGTFLTATINQLTTENFNNMQIVYCRNENEQQEIVNYLDEKCSEIDKLIAKKEQLLTEMENYKKAVIYEYVTGKKEVE